MEIDPNEVCDRNSTQYLVHWKGYSNEDDEWILESGLGHAKELLKDYQQTALG